MKKLHTHSGTLYRILVCLSIITLLTGQASTPTPTPQPEPPTPAEAAYEDWTVRRPVEGYAQEVGAAPVENAAPESSQMLGDCYNPPTIENYTGMVYSALVNKGDWDEDIFFQFGICYHNDKVTQLTNDIGADFEPQLSKDAASIVFVSDRNSTSQATITNIYTMSRSGQNQRRLTTTAAQDRMPSYSPDGKKIVFVSTRTGNAEIFVMNSDGSGQTRLTDSPNADVEPDWSPDGKRIAWVKRMDQGMGVLMVMNANGTGQRALISAQPYTGQPKWSPSGTRLLLRFDNNGDGWLDIGMVNADGSNFSYLNVNRGPIETNDLEVGGWVRDESELVFNNIEYQYIYGGWYIARTSIRSVNIQYLHSSRVISYTDQYLFTPHIRSMDDIPPVTTITELPAFSRYDDVQLQMQLTDNFSGAYTFQVDQSSMFEPGWRWIYSDYNRYEQRESVTKTYRYTGIPGDTVSFRVQSNDYASNKELLKTNPDAQTRLYQWTVQVNTVDARERPLTGVQVQADPAAMNDDVSGEDGLASMFFANSGRYGIGYNKTGYNSDPVAQWLVDDDKDFLAVLTGPNEQLINGYFDDAIPLDGWQQAGVMETNLAAGRYGEKAARLGMVCSDTLCYHNPTLLGAHAAGTPGAEVAMDGDGLAHVRYEGTRYGTVDENGEIVPWPDLPVQGKYGPIYFTPDGAPYMMAEAQYITWDGSGWITDPAPFIQESMVRYEMDSQGRLHVLYNDLACSGCLKYTRRDADGIWIAQRVVSAKKNMVYDLEVESDGTVHIAYASNPLSYTRILPDGTLTSAETFPDSYLIDRILMEFVPGQGLYLLYGGEGHFFKKRTHSGEWVTIGPNHNAGIGEGLQADAAGNVYRFVKIDNIPTISVLLAGDTTFHSYLTPKEIGNIYDFAIDDRGVPHFVTGAGAGSAFQYYYRKGVEEVYEGSGALEQSITIGERMNEPTLSFFYRMETAAKAPGSGFAVTFTPTSGEPVSLFTQAVKSADWAHVWADLKPYQGMSGTLSFRLDQVPGEAPAYVYIDEASVSSYTTPFLRSVEPAPLAFPIAEGTWVDLYGGNIQQGAQVFVVGLPAAQVEWIDSGHIRFLVPNLPQPGRYLVSVVNPNSGEAQIGMYAGLLTFIPFAAR